MAPGSPRRPTECVEAFVYVVDPFRVLLLRRPPGRGGFWVPVSGKIEPTDPDALAGALRELREETGFGSYRRVDPMDWIVGFVGPDGGPWRLQAFAVQLNAAETPVLSQEHDAFEWGDVPTALDRLHFEDNRGAVRRLVDWRARGLLTDGPNV